MTTTRIYGSDSGHLDGRISDGIVYLLTRFPDDTGNEVLSFPIEAKNKLIEWLKNL